MPKARKFIDRKKAVTFHLVHRSQKDPLIVDETAPQHVLLPASVDKTKTSDKTKRKEEQQKYGIFFDDDYDYLQHLRDANQISVDWEPVGQSSNQAAKLKLPSSVFASEVEEDVGLLNRAAPHSGPRLDLDPDIVAAMDEDFDYDNPENELEDNFMELANAEGSDCEDGSDVDSLMDNFSSNGNISDEENDDVASLDGPQYTFADEETKSHFTNYSMSSSMFTKTYGDTDIGPLECEEIDGHIAPDSDLMLQYAKEMEEELKINRPILEPDHDTKETFEVDEFSEEDDEGIILLDVPENPKERWDCESILSTYSNIYNRPKLITEPEKPKKIRVSGKTGIPLGVLDGGSKLTARALAKFNCVDDTKSPKEDETESVVSTLSILSIRPKDETPEERAQRKKSLREYRKERRLEKKANTLAFKEEKKKQEKIILNNKKNIPGIHIV
ncbi:Protein LTV1 [Blattella germanica]|nr:Protein LTV1 [Blattella germanica]